MAVSLDLDEETLKKRNLEQQIDEIELLQSMFSQPGEFVIEDMNAYSLLKSFVEGTETKHPNTIACTIHLIIDSTEGKPEMEFDIELTCRLPNEYPTKQFPEVHVHSDSLTRSAQDNFNKGILEYTKSELCVGDVCLLQIIEWARERAPDYYTPPPVMSQLSHDSSQELDSNHFCRMWLYMHHIYSKTKRRNILSLASDLDLTGFCLPGKPGVVCIEGYNKQTKEFYNVLRRWNWKSITCRKREIIEDARDIDKERKITGFQELVFDTHGQRANHMDLGQFRDYLKTHQLEYMFKELFGVDGNNQSMNDAS